MLKIDKFDRKRIFVENGGGFEFRKLLLTECHYHAASKFHGRLSMFVVIGHKANEFCLVLPILPSAKVH